ncbi:MAG: hypothetical protein K0B52_06060 [FCB group bacterium]|nr:hypothetical protein [FCB group bacterium]
MNLPVLEIFGYAASAIVVLSLMMKNIRRLRWWNLLGAAGFSLYGALIGAWPVFAMNACIAIADIYYLIQMGREKEYFDIMETDVHHSDFIKRFLAYYKDDIKKFFPEFHLDPAVEYRAFFGLRDARPVSLVVFRPLPDNVMLVELDYAIPQYRDHKTGKFIYNEGIRRLGLQTGQSFITKTSNESHQRYLQAIGFKKSGEQDGEAIIYRKRAGA